MRAHQVFICFAVAVAGLSLVHAGLVDGLNEEQTAELKNGGMVVVSKDVPGGSWPELTVYTLVNAPVGKVAEVFQDYDHAQDFQKNLVSAKVVDRPKKNVCDVEYTSKMPIFGTTSYTVRNTYSEKDGGVDVSWKLLESSMADVSDGSLRVEPYEKGSVLRYTNYVKPKSAVAGVAKWAALGEVKKTVAALKAEAERRAK